MAGYFKDGTVNVELGAHAFATPELRRRNVVNEPHDRAARVLDSGGGSVELAVTGQRLRGNLGDAERYAAELLRALAGSGPGALGVEDHLGRRAVFARAVCTGASARVRAFRFCDMRFDFLCPEAEAEASWTGAPATPGTYAGTDTLQDYAAGGVAIGTHPAGMRIEMACRHPLRELPRARGARGPGPARGAVLRFTVTSHAVAASQHLADYLRDLERLIGPRPVALTGNGNTYAACVLEEVRPRHTDWRSTEFEATFLQEVS